MSGLPTRTQWTAACRGAAEAPGTWHRAGDDGPFWVVSPVYGGPEVPVTVHGHAGDIAAVVDESALRHRALLQLVDREADSAIPTGAVHAIVGCPVEQHDRGDLHARTHHRWVTRWADVWQRLPGDPGQRPELRQLKRIRGWRATRWRGRVLLIVWGGAAAARTTAPNGTMTVDMGPDSAAVAVHHAPTWDRVTAALLEASASGGDLLEAAAKAAHEEGDVDG